MNSKVHIIVFLRTVSKER